MDMRLDANNALSALEILGGYFQIVPNMFDFLVQLYNELSNYYVILEGDLCRGSIYGFHARLRFEKKSLDSYFATLLNKEKCDYSNFVKTIGSDFKPDESIIAKIQEF